MNDFLKALEEIAANTQVTAQDLPPEATEADAGDLEVTFDSVMAQRPGR